MVSFHLLLHIQTLKEKIKLTFAEGDRLSTQMCRSQVLVTVFNSPRRVSTHLCADDFPGRCVLTCRGSANRLPPLRDSIPVRWQWQRFGPFWLVGWLLQNSKFVSASPFNQTTQRSHRHAGNTDDQDEVDCSSYFKGAGGVGATLLFCFLTQIHDTQSWCPAFFSRATYCIHTL